MLRDAVTAVAGLALASSLVVAQETQPPAQTPKPAESAAAQTSRAPAQLVNIKLELTLTETRSGGALPPRMVTMVVADRDWGRVRTGQGNMVLNADARPELVASGRVRVALSIEYRRQGDDQDKTPPALLTQTMTTILDDGKPLLISQSADPTSNVGGVKVELKATISK